jgi:sugar phosphate isomerase/epimerase
MTLTRREWLAAGLALPATLGAGVVNPLSLQGPAGGGLARGADAPRSEHANGLGIVSYSFHIRLSAGRGGANSENVGDPLRFLDYCHSLGAGGIQLDLGAKDKSYVVKLFRQAETYDMYIEGSARLPRDKSDVDRFTSEVLTAKEAGIQVLRTVLMSGRRYEILDSADAFRRAADQAWQSLVLAEPIIAREGMRLAIENHKDLRVEELVGMLRRLDSRNVGACVDFGNSIALLEDPMQVVESLAPFAFTTHVKDMAVEEYDQGFLLSEVPLGEGFLDLSKMIETFRRHRADIRFNLEMITRDPLQIPCLDKKYWASSEGLSGKYLAQTLSLVRRHKPKQPLPRIRGLSKDQQLALEEKNVKQCLSYWNQHFRPEKR